VLGAGKIGELVLSGLLRAGWQASELLVTARRAERGRELAERYGVRVVDNLTAVVEADVLAIAVKPQDAGAVLAPLSPDLQQRSPVVLSIAAGVRIEALRGWCGAGVPVIRAMPNRPALVGAGATGLFAPAEVAASHRAMAAQIMQSVGEVVWVAQEDALDVVTAVSGSGPAYFFLLAEAMANAGVELGLPADTARRLSIATLHGAGLLAHGSDGDLARLRAEVTSKGGTTEAALRTLQSASFNDLIGRAIEAATLRGRELAEQAGVISR